MIELFVQLVEALFRLVLVVEHFYDFLAVNHFLDVAFFVRYCGLLSHHIFPAGAAHSHNDEQHYHNNSYYEQSKIYAVVRHKDKYRKQRERRLEQGRKTLSDKLTDGVGIVRIRTHNGAVLMRIEVFYRQRFHIFKHIFTETV